MRELLKKLYSIAGKESQKLSRMIVFEIVKSIFEGISLGAILFLLLKIFEKLFEQKEVVMNDVYIVFGIAVLSVAGKIVFGYLADRNKYIATYNLGAENRLYIGDKLKQVNMGYFNSNRLGHISGGLTSVIGELETVGVNIIEMMFVGIIQTVIMACFMLPFDFITGVIILITLMIGLFVNAVFQNKADQLTKKLQKLKVELNANTLEFVKGIGVIKSFGKNKEMLGDLENSISDNKKGYFNVEKVIVPVNLIFLLVFKLGMCAIILSSIVRYSNGELEPYKTVMLIVSSFIVFAGFEMAGSMQNLRGIAVQNLDAITKLRDIKTISEGQKVTIGNSDIYLKNIDFSYDDKKLFQGVSAFIPSGKTTALIGASGSGKSTICNLIARFWDVDSGEIIIDGTNVKDYRYDNLLSNFSFVFQDVYLFDDTVKNNIAFGNPDATDDEIVEVAKHARCHDFIMALPDGYETILQEGGSNLSGGERQRISIARAMLKPSKIVILDEATSSVDPENEQELVAALNDLLKDKTVIVIAHKLETIKSSDQIIVMDKGSIENVGTHKELMKSSSIYKKFIEQREKAIQWKLND
ncbi:MULTISPECIES: ABC transporter ATP-binding protein [Streptococcus anginosus group]|jgi:ABC transporter, ATP-binding/permease protein|uniref:Multidrug resistance ABC transporter ATP-binding and permease protein n=3 Tax=Bacillota TaxID=1239 RepID=I0SEH1_STRAP|nr:MULTISPECIES: ABC transporter ATP-binding protein [Streptococcus anginosus group]EGT4617544.1 ABC transporter ATP-binding protein [Clostridioides difficile]AGU83725.1 putative ABC transporter, ATP-binding/permease protein [Streptococcus anginosus C238]EID21774.1 ABC transporter, ATP-binding protein [Streptococcus anginosus subsp. whileyi CCUG 39159]MDP1384293.1 ABC transporter ATP-binding protein [Streptococcus anginosus]QQT08103.1 ABC transporter ATP-binding protein [Streptococcus anginosu